MGPAVDQKTVEAAAEPLRTGPVNCWTGVKGMEFEARFAERAGTKCAVSLTQGASALHTALAQLGIGTDAVLDKPVLVDPVRSEVCALARASVAEDSVVPRDLPLRD